MHGMKVQRRSWALGLGQKSLRSSFSLLSARSAASCESICAAWFLHSRCNRRISALCLASSSSAAAASADADADTEPDLHAHARTDAA
jgi:hypothetical protein